MACTWAGQRGGQILPQRQPLLPTHPGRLWEEVRSQIWLQVSEGCPPPDPSKAPPRPKASLTSDPNKPGWVAAHCCWPLGSALARGTLMSAVWPLEPATTQNRLPVWSPALPGEQRTEGGSLCGPEQGPHPSDENPGAMARTAAHVDSQLRLLPYCRPTPSWSRWPTLYLPQKSMAARSLLSTRPGPLRCRADPRCHLRQPL